MLYGKRYMQVTPTVRREREGRTFKKSKNGREAGPSSDGSTSMVLKYH